VAVGHLPQSCALRPAVRTLHAVTSHRLCIHRILEAISPDPDEPLVVPATSLSQTSFAQPGPSSSTWPSAAFEDAASADRYAAYAARLAPLAELEDRLIAMLSEDADDNEATRLADGSAPGWLTNGNGNGSIGSAHSSSGSGASAPPTPGGAVRPTIQLDTHSLPASPAARSPVARGVEVAVRTTSNWKQALAELSRRNLKSTSPHGGEVLGWWENPDDPVHVLFRCQRDMHALWADPWVRGRLGERRIRLEESSGL
jgi:hypothetical protein